MSQRTDRVSDLIRAELADVIRREVKDPRVGLATVTTVLVSRDLSHARVGISVLGEEAARLESVEALVRARGFIRSRLGRRVRLRTVPELEFVLDRGAEHSQKISQILENLDLDQPERP